MKKYKIVIILMLALSLTMTLAAQDPKAMVKKCVDALGGKEGIDKIYHFQAEGKFTISMMNMEFSGTFNGTTMFPKSRVDVKVTFNGTTFAGIQAYNGKKAWGEQMGNIADAPAMNYESDNAHTLKLLLAKDAKLSPVKSTEIDGKKVSGVQIELKDKKTVFYIDMKSGLPMEIAFKDNYIGQKNTRELIEMRVRFQQWKRVKGVMFPTIQQKFKKSKKMGEFTYEKLNFAPKAAADFFDRPDQEMDMRYTEERYN